MSLQHILDELQGELGPEVGPDTSLLMLALERMREMLEAQRLMLEEHDARLKAHKSEFLKELTIIYERQMAFSEKQNLLAAEVAELRGKRPIKVVDVPISDPSAKSYSITRPALNRWRWDPKKRRRVHEKRSSDTGHDADWHIVSEAE